jgi:putative oxidoreductase
MAERTAGTQDRFGWWVALAPKFQSILRIVAAVAFMLHGTQKLFAFPSGLPGGFKPQLMSQVGIAGVLETVGGALLVLGLFTRPVAFLLSGEMAVAYLQMHMPRSFWPGINGGEVALLYCFLWLFYSAAGGGPWSIDATRQK